jgi:hypothetical protein
MHVGVSAIDWRVSRKMYAESFGWIVTGRPGSVEYAVATPIDAPETAPVIETAGVPETMHDTVPLFVRSKSTATSCGSWSVRARTVICS